MWKQLDIYSAFCQFQLCDVLEQAKLIDGEEIGSVVVPLMQEGSAGKGHEGTF